MIYDLVLASSPLFSEHSKNINTLDMVKMYPILFFFFTMLLEKHFK